jgi:Family of unknown function (DUF5343)
MEAQTSGPTPAYFAFKTLTNVIEKMEEHGPPNRVDRTFLSNMSGAGQTQFIAGLKALGLIDGDGRVQPRLTEMVSEPDNRQRIMGEVVRECYPDAVALGQTNATTGELLEVFSNAHGVQGDTARKAIAFFLQAAKYAGDIQLSPNFKTPTIRTGAGSGRKRGRPSKKTGAGEGTPPAPPSNGLPSGLHPALAGLLGDLPRRGQTWTQQQHDQFKAAFDAILPIAAPISYDPSDEPSDDDFVDDE